MKVLYSGWLPKNDSLPWEVNGVPIAQETRTRKEEYAWAAGLTVGDYVLDAATGYMNTWHMLPYILAEGHPKRTIVTYDTNKSTLKMPAHPQVERYVGDIRQIKMPDRYFDSVLCISTLEHLQPKEQQEAIAELIRVCGGRLILTADEAPWLPTLFGLSADSEPAPFAGLKPPVYAFAADVLL